MRKGYDGLSGLVRNELGADALSGDVYIFFNGSRRNVKLLKLTKKHLIEIVLYILLNFQTEQD